MIGGLVRLAVSKIKKSDDEKKAIENDGILFCSGMIAGEGLVGILLALSAIFGIDKMIDLSGMLGIPAVVSDMGGIVLLALIVLTVLKFSLWKKRSR
jgi:hypothetical protein